MIDLDPSPYTLSLLIPTILHQSCNSSGGDTLVADADWDVSYHGRINSGYKHQNKIGNTLEKVLKKYTTVRQIDISHLYDLHSHVLIFDPPMFCPSSVGVYDRTTLMG